MWVILLCLISRVSTQEGKERIYKPEWEDLDTRPLPQWYDVAKIGIFIHWGVYSVPAFKNEWFWHFWRLGDPEIMEFLKNISYTGTYKDFASNFKAESFEPDKWAALFAESGAQYVVLTAKHHDGFALFPSRVSDWNSVDIGPEKDIVGMLSESVRKYDMKFGVYYSLLEWFNEMYNEDKENKYSTSVYTDTVIWPDIKQLVNNYEPSVLWSDGDWDATDSYWRSTDLLAWLYNKSPVKNEIVANDRWGLTTWCQHGDFYICHDRFNPKRLLNHKWESAFSIDMQSWSYREKIEPSDIMTFEQILHMVVTVVSCGGNALINVGPTKEGVITPIFKERLLQLGEWLNINGEAIYDTSPWFHQSDSLNRDVWYTCKKETFDPLRTSSKPKSGDVILAVYAIFFVWPQSNILSLRDLIYYVKKDLMSRIVLLSTGHFIPINVSNVPLEDTSKITRNMAIIYTYCETKYTKVGDTLELHLPETHINSRCAWAIKITEFKET